MQIEDFGPFKLSPGAHSGPKKGMCVMEMVSFLNGEAWTDHPECVCPVLAEFCRVVNDSVKQAERDQLQRFVPMLVGTVAPWRENARAEILAWAAIRKFAPSWLRKAGEHDEAEKLASFSGTLKEAETAAAAAARAANAAVYAAYDAARAANAAVYAAYDAARAANAAAAANANAAVYAAYDAARAADAAYNAEIFPLVLDALEEAIKAGPHGETYTDDHLDRAADLRRLVTS